MQQHAYSDSSAAPQNGQYKPHLYPKGSARLAVDTTGQERVGFRTKGKLKTDIPGCVKKDVLMDRETLPKV